MEMKALRLVTAHRSEERELLGCLDAFGEGLIAKRVGEQDGVGDERAGFGFFGDAGDE